MVPIEEDLEVREPQGDVLVNRLVPDFRQKLGEAAQSEGPVCPDLPESGFSSPSRIRRSVDFPAPFRPMSATRSQGLERQLGAAKDGLIADSERQAGEGE